MMPIIIGVRREPRSHPLERCRRVRYQFCGLSAEIKVGIVPKRLRQPVVGYAAAQMVDMVHADVRREPAQNSNRRSGRIARNGVFPRRRFVEALITTCQEFCAGSQRTTACTMSTICVAAYPITGCRKLFETIPICVASVGSRCFKAFAALGLRCGMRAAGG